MKVFNSVDDLALDLHLPELAGNAELTKVADLEEQLILSCEFARSAQPGNVIDALRDACNSLCLQLLGHPVVIDLGDLEEGSVFCALQTSRDPSSKLGVQHRGERIKAGGNVARLCQEVDRVGVRVLLVLVNLLAKHRPALIVELERQDLIGLVVCGAVINSARHTFFFCLAEHLLGLLHADDRLATSLRSFLLAYLGGVIHHAVQDAVLSLLQVLRLTHERGEVCGPVRVDLDPALPINWKSLSHDYPNRENLPPGPPVMP